MLQEKNKNRQVFAALIAIGFSRSDARRALMLYAGINGDELAKSIDIANAYLSQILNGVRVGQEKRKAIAERLSVPVDELFDVGEIPQTAK